MATVINDIESVRLTVGSNEYTLEKGGQISVEAIGNDIIFYRAGNNFMRLAYTLFTTPTFTSASDGRSQIEAFLAGGSSTATYAEDSVHTSGDTGTFVLAVRTDPDATGLPSARAANGDYIPFIVDNLGALWVRPRAYAGTADVIGATVGSNDFVSVAITRPANTTAYAANDVMNNGADTTPLVFTIARANNLRGYVVSGTAISSNGAAATLPNIDLLLFSSTFTIAADNAAFAPTYAQMQTLLGIVQFTTFRNRGGIAEAFGVIEKPFPFEVASGTQNIYGVLLLQNAYTPASSETLQFSIGVEQY